MSGRFAGTHAVVTGAASGIGLAITQRIVEEGGMVVAGRNPDRNLVEIIELPNHPFFVGVQFHPELKSRPNRPHPLFRDFIGAVVKIHQVKD